MTRSIEFKPDVTVRIEYDEDTGVRVSANGAKFHWPAHSKPGPHEEQLYPGFTERFNDICKPLGENEAWLHGARFLVSAPENLSWFVGAARYPLTEIRFLAAKLPDPEGWPRVLAIAERSLAEREPKLEARWEELSAKLFVDGKWYNTYIDELTSQRQRADLDQAYPGAWEKHVLPCILANRPLKENEYRLAIGSSAPVIWSFEWRPDNGGEVIATMTTGCQWALGWTDLSIELAIGRPLSLVEERALEYLRKKNAEYEAARSKKPSARLFVLLKARVSTEPSCEVMDALAAVGALLDEEFERRGGGA
jgi:hypothetical protein